MNSAIAVIGVILGFAVLGMAQAHDMLKVGTAAVGRGEKGSGVIHVPPGTENTIQTPIQSVSTINGANTAHSRGLRSRMCLRSAWMMVPKMIRRYRYSI